jgi:hypothetical protein
MRASGHGGFFTVRGRQVFVCTFAVVAALSGVIAYATRPVEPTEEQKSFARLATVNKLIQQHWKNLEAMTEFRPVIDRLNEDFFASFASDVWTLKVLSGPNRSDHLDGFENAALRLVEKG